MSDERIEYGKCTCGARAYDPKGLICLGAVMFGKHEGKAS